MKGKTKSLRWIFGISCLVLLFSQGLFAQGKIKTTGTIVDSKDNTGLPGATVSLEGGNTSTIADQNGKFEISVPVNSKLRITMTGYEGKTVKATANLVITLTSTNVELEDVVVIGYGTQRKSKSTAAISSIKSEEISLIPTSNLSNILAGRLSGLCPAHWYCK